ncbi:MAG: hypothetical protein JWQ42_3983 [Edaphobacter sp.]|nr:hypothetical protein [Edaphobacter sp.]
MRNRFVYVSLAFLLMTLGHGRDRASDKGSITFGTFSGIQVDENRQILAKISAVSGQR